MQRYWPHLVQMIKDGKIDPSFVVTHGMFCFSLRKVKGGSSVCLNAAYHGVQITWHHLEVA